MKGAWYRNEKFWFILMAILSLIPFFFVRYIPSLDGPQHLYSVNIFKNILLGNEAVKEYFVINPMIVGYWATHFIMGFFHLFLPAFLAEKLFIVIYLLSLYFSFRYLVSSLGRKNSFISLFIIPFALSNFFLMGYYNFTLGLSAGFLVLGYWLRHRNYLKLKQWFILCLLLLLLYLTHALIFAFTGAILGLYLIIDMLRELAVGKSRGNCIKDFLLQGLRLLTAALPALVLFIIYFRFVSGLSTSVEVREIGLTERLKDLYELRLLHGFRQDLERYPTIGMFILLLSLIIYKLVQVVGRIRKGGFRETMLNLLKSPGNVWLFISLFLLMSYLIIPDNFATGSLVKRVGLIFLYSLLIWLAQKSFPFRLQLIVMIPVLILFIQQKVLLQNQYIKLNKDIAEIEELSEHMKEAAVYYPVNESRDWMAIHFTRYAGADRCLISMRSPQSDGQFPVRWNHAKIPLNYVGDSLIRHGLSLNYEGTAPREIRLADYVLRYQDCPKNEKIFYDEDLGRIVERFYTPIYTSSGGRATLYEFSAQEEIDAIKKRLKSSPPAKKLKIRAQASGRNLSIDSYLLLLAVEEFAAHTDLNK